MEVCYFILMHKRSTPFTSHNIKLYKCTILTFTYHSPKIFAALLTSTHTQPVSGLFAPWTFRPMDTSPYGRTFRPIDVSPHRHFVPWTSHPRWFTPETTRSKDDSPHRCCHRQRGSCGKVHVQSELEMAIFDPHYIKSPEISQIWIRLPRLHPWKITLIN